MRKFVAAALLALALPLHANAVLITSSAGTFEVTAVDVRGTDPVLGSTAWWGSESLAREFAGLVNNDLGIDWVIPVLAGVGPLFAYRNQGDDSYYAVYVSTILGSYVTTKITDEDDIHTYAISRRVGTTAVPEPASIALLCIGLLAFGVRRRLTLR